MVMNTTIFSIRLHEARNMLGWSMDELSEHTGRTVTKQSISKYEKGLMLPRFGTLSVLAKALNISLGYFSGDTIRLDEPMLRNAFKESLPTDEVQHLESMLSFWTERYIEAEKKTGMETSFVNPIAHFSVSTLEQASEAASLLREAWRCGDGPIPSILRLMERKGIKILDRQLPTGVLGMSTRANGSYPLVVIDMSHEKHTVERLRFTAAHELGHVVLNIPEEIGIEDRENLCNKFAGLFLLPQSTIIEELGCVNKSTITLTLDELIDLHELYGVSVAALVHEAWDLRIISREHYDWWYDERIKKNRKEIGWGTYLFPETIGREKRVESKLRITK